MLKEGPTPMTTHECCAENISLGREVRGDEGKDVQRDTVHGTKGVFQFTGRYECGEYIAFELRNHIIGDAEMIVSASFYDEPGMFPRRTAEGALCDSAPS